MTARPIIFVLAGVNGAGKSSIGGEAVARKGLGWFNPDTFTRKLAAESGLDLATANARAWAEGVRQLDQAVAGGLSHAFETTLGGWTIPAKLKAAARSHDVEIWFCGLASPDLHVARVKVRVANGGHDIPEAKIRERYTRALGNLIDLMPHLSYFRAYDNSATVLPGMPVPDPFLVLETHGPRVVYPTDAESLKITPDWAGPIVEAALQMAERG